MQTFKDALFRVHALSEKKGSHILHTSEISRMDRTLLVRNGWLEEIIRGWYLLVRPDVEAGDSTAWYANFWDFLKVYLNHHYKTDYCLSAESSIDLQIGNTVIPKQVIVMTQKGSTTPVQLPYDTSLLTYKASADIPNDREIVKGLQVMTLNYALCKITPTFFQKSPHDMEIALRSVPSTADLLRVIVEHDFKSAAGRLVGAYRFLGDVERADDLKNSLLDVGYIISEKNPFELETPLISNLRFQSPHIGRILTMWEKFRPVVITHFPSPPGLSKNPNSYMRQISEKYAQDAYNSLSIEGYHVSKELIQKVMEANWSPDSDPYDKQQRDALAARGYYEAHLLVKRSIESILNLSSPGEVIENDLPKWFQKLFAPSVQAGILTAAELFGYRRHQVYIRYSRHTPLAKEYLGEAMNTFFQCLKREEHPAVRAILGHFIFVYIHPYMDGNGRLGRFLMNAMLASGGYPWTVIPVSRRNEYLTSLESASVDGNIEPFTRFVASNM